VAYLFVDIIRNNFVCNLGEIVISLETIKFKLQFILIYNFTFCIFIFCVASFSFLNSVSFGNRKYIIIMFAVQKREL